MRVTRNRTRRSGCLIVGHACHAAPRVASLFVLIHICTTVRTGPPNCTLRAGSGGACAVTLACRHICLAHAPYMRRPCRLHPFLGLLMRARRVPACPACAPVRYARATDPFQLPGCARDMRGQPFEPSAGRLSLQPCLLVAQVASAPCGSSRFSYLHLLVVRASLLCGVIDWSSKRRGIRGGADAWVKSVRFVHRWRLVNRAPVPAALAARR